MQSYWFLIPCQFARCSNGATFNEISILSAAEHLLKSFAAWMKEIATTSKWYLERTLMQLDLSVNLRDKSSTMDSIWFASLIRWLENNQSYPSKSTPFRSKFQVRCVRVFPTLLWKFGALIEMLSNGHSPTQPLPDRNKSRHTRQQTKTVKNCPIPHTFSSRNSCRSLKCVRALIAWHMNRLDLVTSKNIKCSKLHVTWYPYDTCNKISIKLNYWTQ